MSIKTFIAALLITGTGITACATLSSVTNAEEPDYTVVKKEDNIELRDYGSMIAAQFNTSGERYQAARNAFRPLANYIFAKERAPGSSEEKIAMTAPVTQSYAEGEWNIRFIMPKKYKLEDLPVPADNVKLIEIEPKRMAVLRFSGKASDEDFENTEIELKNWIYENGLKQIGDPIFAYYDLPMTPSFMRRNEILIEVEK